MPFAGPGVFGIGGGGGGDAVLNDHTGPVVAPAALRAMSCQKYVVLAARPDRAYDVLVSPVATWDGGFVVPNRAS